MAATAHPVLRAIDGKAALAHYKSKGFKVPKSVAPEGSNCEFHVQHEPRKLLVDHIVDGMTIAQTRFDSYDTPKGTIINNVQTHILGGNRRAGVEKALHEAIDSNIGQRIGLDFLKAAQPDRALHILSPGEERERWGKFSVYHLTLPNFWAYVRREHPENLGALLARAIFEKPGMPDNILTLQSGLAKGEVRAARRIVEDAKCKAKASGRPKSRGLVKGRRLLRSVMSEYLASGGHKPLGKRRSNRYYRDVPMEHGFVEQERPVDFGRYRIQLWEDVRPIRVLTYEPPKDMEGIKREATGREGFEKLLRKRFAVE